MPQLPAWLFCHTVTVEPYEGHGAYGEVYGAPVANVPCLADFRVRKIRAATGEEVTSTATVYAAPGRTCPVGSRVTLPDGRTTTALAVGPHTAPGLGLPECTEVSCE